MTNGLMMCITLKTLKINTKKMELPNFKSYGDYSSDNYGVNCLLFNYGGISIYFSYQTIVAFRHSKTGLVISTNEWGNTTGKHLNWIDRDKKIRIPHKDVLTKLASVMKS